MVSSLPGSASLWKKLCSCSSLIHCPVWETISTKLWGVNLVVSLNGSQSYVDPQPPCRCYFVQPPCLCNEQSTLTSVWFSWRKKNCHCWTWLPGKFNSIRAWSGWDLEVQFLCASAYFVSVTWEKSADAGKLQLGGFLVPWQSLAEGSLKRHPVRQGHRHSQVGESDFSSLWAATNAAALQGNQATQEETAHGAGSPPPSLLHSRALGVQRTLTAQEEQNLYRSWKVGIKLKPGPTLLGIRFTNKGKNQLEESNLHGLARPHGGDHLPHPNCQGSLSERLPRGAHTILTIGS